MKRSEELGVIRRFCDFLGRQNCASFFLDRIARWTVPLPPSLGLVTTGLPGAVDTRRKDLRELLSRPLLMASGPLTRTITPNKEDWPYRGDAPATPHDKHTGQAKVIRVIERVPWWKFWDVDTVASQVERGSTICAEEKYHGMHGTPCAYAGGTDMRCPKGTVSGWFWSYKTKNGVYFYVDCCGGTPVASAVWCNWSNENNWCYGSGKAQNQGASQEYNCTLAIPSHLMQTTDVTGKAPQVVGVD